MKDEHVILAKGLSQEMAMVLVTALQSAEIEAFSKTENLGGYVPGGVNSLVFVRKKDLVAARAIMREKHGDDEPPTRNEKSWRRNVRSVGLFGAFLCVVAVTAFAGYQVGARNGMREKSSSLAGKVRVDSMGRKFLESDRDGDGIAETVEYLDDSGNVVTVKMDRDHNGYPDSVDEYDTKGSLLRHSEDTNDDGKLDSWSEYKAGEKLTSRKRDLNFDGEVDTTDEFDAYGKPTRSTTIVNGKLIDRTYYKDWRVTETQVDLARKGKLDTVLLYDDYGVVKSIKPYK